MVLLPPLHDDWDGEVLGQLLRDADGSRPGTTAPVRAPEGLVEVEEAHIEPRVSGAGDPHDAVEVSLIVGAEPTRLVNYLRPLVDVRVEDARVLRVRHEDARRVLRHRGLQRLDARVTRLIVGVEGNHLEARRRRARGVARVAEDGRDDLVALLELATAPRGTCAS